MKTKEAIVTTLSHLDDQLNVEVGTSMAENQNPRPQVVLNDYSRNDERFHNTARRGNEFDDDGNPVSTVYHKYYTLMLDFRVRARDEERGYSVTENLRGALLPLEERPNNLHEDIRELQITSSGGVNPHHNLESSEGTFNVSVELDTFERWSEVPDVLEAVETNYDYDYDSN
jgi:hypothetical protein